MSAQPNLRPVETGSDDDAFRSPPQNLEAEQALLGAILVNNEACDRVTSFLTPEHFFEPLHARIFETATPVQNPAKICLPLDPYGWTGKQLDCANTNPNLVGDIYECLTGIQSENRWR